MQVIRALTLLNIQLYIGTRHIHIIRVICFKSDIELSVIRVNMVTQAMQPNDISKRETPGHSLVAH